jgi:hypothetical protein
MTPEEYANFTQEQKQETSSLERKLDVARNLARQKSEALRGASAVQMAQGTPEGGLSTTQQGLYGQQVSLSALQSGDLQAKQSELRGQLKNLQEQQKQGYKAETAKAISDINAQIEASNQQAVQQASYNAQADTILGSSAYAGMTPEEQETFRTSFIGLPDSVKQQMYLSAIKAEEPIEFSTQVDNTTKTADVLASMISSENLPNASTIENLAQNSLYTADQLSSYVLQAQEIIKTMSGDERTNALNALAMKVNGSALENASKAKEDATISTKDFDYYQALLKTNPTLAAQFAREKGYTADQISNISGNTTTSTSGITATLIGNEYNVNIPANYETKLSRVTGNPGAQCAEFVNDLVADGNIFIPQDKQDKLNKITHGAESAVAGDIFIEDIGKYGHTGFIDRVYQNENGEWVADTTEFNYNNDQTRSDRIAVPLTKFAGFVDNPNLPTSPEEISRRETIKANVVAITSGLGGSIEERSTVQNEMVSGIISGKYTDVKDAASKLGISTKTKAEGTQLPATQVTMISDGAQMPEILNGLDKFVTDPIYSWVFDPTLSKIKWANPINLLGYDDEMKNADSKLRTARQLIGKYMEGGVLRKEDEEKYEKMLPLVGDTVSQAQEKIKNVKQMLSDKTAGYIDAFGSQGYDVSGFAELYSKLKNDISSSNANNIVEQYTDPLNDIQTKYGF